MSQEPIKIIAGHFYALKVDGIRVKVRVKEIVHERYAKVQQKCGKITTCGTHQLRPV